MDDPKLVIEQVLNSPVGSEKSEPNRVELQPLTIRRYALLERLKSPFLDTDADFTANNILPTLMVMCSTTDRIREMSRMSYDDVMDAALDWSDENNLSLEELGGLLKKLSDEFYGMEVAAPESNACPIKKKETRQGGT